MERNDDDFIVVCRSEKQEKEALERVRRWVEDNGLTLHPTKTRLVNASQAGGFVFLGYHFERGMKWLRKKLLPNRQRYQLDFSSSLFILGAMSGVE